MFETVLFPLDHSREAVEAATKALDLARSHNSRLILLSVVQSERPEMHDHAVVATLLAETQARFEKVGVSCGEGNTCITQLNHQINLVEVALELLFRLSNVPWIPLNRRCFHGTTKTGQGAS